MTAHDLLRAATRAAHDQVDALFSMLDLAEPADYRRFLSAQASAFLPTEAALEAGGVATLFPDWLARRRAHLLRADLDALGLTVPAPHAPLPFATPEEVAGGAYVLEGSRLGGAMLLRALPDGVARHFLGAPQTGVDWRTFLAQLEQVLGTPVQRRRAVAGAQRVFDSFASAARDAMKGH